MNAAQFKQAFSLADSDTCLSLVDDTHLFGYGLPDFKPVFTTIEAVAKIIRWQARYLNGKWDQNELNEIARLGRKRFLILNDEGGVN